MTDKADTDISGDWWQQENEAIFAALKTYVDNATERSRKDPISDYKEGCWHSAQIAYTKALEAVLNLREKRLRNFPTPNAGR